MQMYELRLLFATAMTNEGRLTGHGGLEAEQTVSMAADVNHLTWRARRERAWGGYSTLELACMDS